MQKRVAKIILTYSCPKKCSYCLNDFEQVWLNQKHLFWRDDIPEFKEYHLTGGEPMSKSCDSHAIEVAKRIRKSFPTGKIYLYTAIHSIYFEDILPDLNGITYTLHDSSDANVEDFLKTQEVFGKFPEKKFRLNLMPGVDLNKIKASSEVFTEFCFSEISAEKDYELAKDIALFYLPQVAEKTAFWERVKQSVK